VPKYLGVCDIDNEHYIELQDLLHGFKDPNVMDIKMGCRTFLESEVANTTLRPDLYKKMMEINEEAPNAEEHRLKAITKLRYMMFREQLSSTQDKGFRIEALKMTGLHPVTDLKMVKTHSEIKEIFSHFLKDKKSVTKEFMKRLKNMRTLMEKSTFFHTHEIIGSSVFIVYDDDHAGAWLIDFAKTRKLPKNMKVDHRKPWSPGNCEEGILHGMDELIKVFEDVYSEQQKSSNTCTSKSTTTNNIHDKCDSRKCSR
jgi:1D-myo-inositol-triphosphate 3-kinase